MQHSARCGIETNLPSITLAAELFLLMLRSGAQAWNGAFTLCLEGFASLQGAVFVILTAHHSHYFHLSSNDSNKKYVFHLRHLFACSTCFLEFSRAMVSRSSDNPDSLIS